VGQRRRWIIPLPIQFATRIFDLIVYTYCTHFQYSSHTHDKNNTSNPQTNTAQKHLTTLEGGATTVRATSHARVGVRAEVRVGGWLEVRRGN